MSTQSAAIGVIADHQTWQLDYRVTDRYWTGDLGLTAAAAAREERGVKPATSLHSNNCDHFSELSSSESDGHNQDNRAAALSQMSFLPYKDMELFCGALSRALQRRNGCSIKTPYLIQINSHS